MKLLDRYVLVLFLKNYLISLTVLIGTYVVMDMVLRFDDIVNVEKQMGGSGLSNILQTLADVGGFYFYRCFAIFVQMSGIIPVMAAGFTLVRLSRFNELTAFLAAGVPMLRMTISIIVCALLLNLLTIADQELILPHMASQLVRSHDEMHQSNANQYPISAMQVDQHSVLVSGMYDADKFIMRDMDVVDRNDNLMPTSHLKADYAKWNTAEHRWDLTGGTFISGLLPGQHSTPETAVATYGGDANTVTPAEINLYHGSAEVEYLSTSTINALLKRPKSYGAAGLYKIKNLRWTQPFMNVVLLLLAIPAVLTFDPKTLKTAATKSLLLMGLALSSVFLCQQIAGKPPLGPAWVSLWPELMSWMPIFIFAPLAVFLMDRVKT